MVDPAVACLRGRMNATASMESLLTTSGRRIGVSPWAAGALLATTLLIGGTTHGAAPTQPWMLETSVAGRRIEGMPISWSEQRVHLVGRDGRLWEFGPQEATNTRKTADYFRPLSQAELRAALELELGSTLEISGTRHYLVAHPRGRGSQWAQRFEDLYRSFAHYFSVRGFKVREPDFPLVAIVWSDRDEFHRHAMREGTNLPAGTLGYYSPTTNRIVLYDTASGDSRQQDWTLNASTIIHEATHQSAFNTGVHSRYAPPPRWIAEGLGMLYEARGIYDSRRYANRADRINSGRLADFKQYRKAAFRTGELAEFVASDRAFRANIGVAYAEAWALTSFLAEKHPQKYCALLKQTAENKPFADYPSARRIADFTRIFGSNLTQLEAEFLRYIDEL